MSARHGVAALWTGRRFAWIPAPDAPASHTLVSWGSADQLVGGGAVVSASRYAARTIELSWSNLTRSELLLIQDMLTWAGEDEIIYRDDMNSGGNILSPFLGRPHLHADSLTPLAYDDKGTVLGRTVDVNNGPLKALEFTGAQAADGKPHVYREHVLIPPGADMHIVASGALTAPGLIQVTGGVNVSSAAITRIPGLDDAPRIVDVTVTAPAVPDQVLTWVRAAFTARGASAPDLWPYATPEGFGSMRVEPGSLAVTGVNPAYGLFSATVTLREVWPWL